MNGHPGESGAPGPEEMFGFAAALVAVESHTRLAAALELVPLWPDLESRGTAWSERELVWLDSAMDDPEPRVSWAAARLLALDRDRGVTRLLSAMSSGTVQARWYAVELLADSARPRVDVAVRHAATDPNPRVRRRAIRALLPPRQAADVTALMLAAAMHPDEVRVVGDGLRPVADEHKSALLNATSARDPAMRETAAIALSGALGVDRVVGALTSLLGDSDDGVRRSALASLRAIPPAPGVVLAALSAEDPAIRSAGAAMLEHLGGDDAFDSLVLTACQNEDPEVRRRGVAAMAARPKGNLATLLDLAADQDDSVRGAALAALEPEMPSLAVAVAATQSLVGEVGIDSGPALRILRRATLASDPSIATPAVATLATLAQGPDAELRAGAVAALGPTAHMDVARHALVTALTDPELQVAQAAAQNLAESTSIAGHEALFAAMRHPDRRLSSAAMLGMARSGNRVLLSRLLAAARSGPPGTRGDALRIVAHLDPEVGRSEARSLMTDRSAEVRHAAAQILNFGLPLRAWSQAVYDEPALPAVSEARAAPHASTGQGAARDDRAETLEYAEEAFSPQRAEHGSGGAAGGAQEYADPYTGARPVGESTPDTDADYHEDAIAGDEYPVVAGAQEEGEGDQDRREDQAHKAAQRAMQAAREQAQPPTEVAREAVRRQELDRQLARAASNEARRPELDRELLHAVADGDELNLLGERVDPGLAVVAGSLLRQRAVNAIVRPYGADAYGSLSRLVASAERSRDAARTPDANSPTTPRYLNTWLTQPGADAPLPSTEPLMAGSRYEVSTQIGPMAMASAVLNGLNNPFVELGGAHTPVQVTIQLLSDDVEVDPSDPVPLTIPATGASEVLKFGFVTPKRSDPIRMRLVARHGAIVVMSQYIDANVGGDGGYVVVIDYVLTANMSQLGALPADQVAIQTAPGATGGIEVLVGLPTTAAFSTILSDGKIRTAAELMRSALREVHFVKGHGKSRYDANNGCSRKQALEDLALLAQRGWSLYQNTVTQPSRRRELRDVLRKGSRAMQRPSRIQVVNSMDTSEGFPWQLVYDIPVDGQPPEFNVCSTLKEWLGSSDTPPPPACPHEHPNNTLCAFGFWGFAYELASPPSTPGIDRALVVRAPVPGKAGVVAALSNRLDPKTTDAHLTRLGREFTISRAHGIKELQSMIYSSKPSILYFYCHGRRKEYDTASFQPLLEIGTEDLISPEDLAAWSEEWPEPTWETPRPLVFLNGCHTSELTPDLLMDFVGSFNELNASGCIGTEVDVSQAVASEVAELLLSAFATADDLAGAMRSMRWALLRKGNAMGLNYTPYAYGGLRLRGPDDTTGEINDGK